MRYYSLNDPKLSRSFSTAVLEGQPSGGGLFYPEDIPRDLGRLFERPPPSSLASTAVELLAPMVAPEINQQTLRGICQETFAFPIPLVQIKPHLWVLELFHGPTAAFKDVGARFLSRVIRSVSESHLTILVATSGDTGGAVAHGFHGVEGIDVVILYPKGRVSPLQERQLTGLGGNITALEIEGSFDDCQRMVKAALGDDRLKSIRPLSSANSINIARWLPQGVYYAWALHQLQAQVLSNVEPPAIIVPSGNLGNLAAGLFAWRRGIELGEMIAATNRNDRFTRYVRTGQFEPAASVLTPSNAMDVGDPSNRTRVDALFNQDFKALSAKLNAYSVSDEETLNTIKEAFQSTGYLFCPHSAVAYAVHERRLAEGLAPSGQDTVLLATAHPAKFSEVVAPAIGGAPPLPPSLRALAQGEPSKPQLSLPPSVERFKDYLRSSAPLSTT